MLKPPLTDLSIRKLLPASGTRIEVFDHKVPGFAIRVFPSGAKSFVLFYRFGGRLRRITLGRYPIISLAEGRILARDVLHKIAHGQDPAVAKNKKEPYWGFSESCRTFSETYCAHHNRVSTRNHRELVLKNRFETVWRDRDIRTITKGDVLRVLDSIIEERLPSAANDAFVTIRKFFNWCVERGLIEFNPCRGMRRPAKTQSRSRVLTDDELRSVWIAAQKIGYPYGAIVQLLTLTAQRRSEVASLRRNDLDFARRIWTLAPETTKNCRGHVLPLSPLAMDIILSVPSTIDVHLFPSRTRLGHFDDFAKPKKRLDRLSGVSAWTLHDLRRSAATGLARLGVSPHVVEQILNHRSGTLSGVAGIYNRFGYLEEMREALEKWQTYIDNLLTQTPPQHPHATVTISR